MTLPGECAIDFTVAISAPPWPFARPMAELVGQAEPSFLYHLDGHRTASCMRRMPMFAQYSISIRPLMLVLSFYVAGISFGNCILSL